MTVQSACFMKNGSIYKVSSRESLELHDSLPIGNYIVTMDPFEQLQLQLVDSFERNGKLYGNTTKHATRILNTFLDRPASTGVMLAGEKGSGKTLLSKEISINAAEMGFPTIIINTPWCGDKFNKFMQSITQPCVVIFDEFEKVYDKEDQEHILTLLDGVFSTKKLFVLTCNDKWKVDSHMRNRPGRIFYMIDFKGLDDEFIREYCNDNLVNKSQIDNVCKFALLFDNFNFDMLKALVEDMNRYNESPSEVMQLLNAKPEFSLKQHFDIRMSKNGNTIDKKFYEDSHWYGNPLECTQVRLDYRDLKEDGLDEWEWKRMAFNACDLDKIDAINGIFTYVNDLGESLELSKQVTFAHDYNKYF